jgi:hypothetical protein
VLYFGRHRNDGKAEERALSCFAPEDPVIRSASTRDEAGHIVNP